jgi:hypothetical protein
MIRILIEQIQDVYKHNRNHLERICKKLIDSRFFFSRVYNLNLKIQNINYYSLQSSIFDILPIIMFDVGLCFRKMSDKQEF